MTLPSTVRKTTLLGFVRDTAGRPGKGKIRFAPSVSAILDSESNTFFTPASVPVPLDELGYFEVELLSTTNPGLSVNSWSYKVIYELDANSPKTHYIKLEEGIVKFATVVPIAEDDGVLITKGEKGDRGEAGAPGDGILAAEEHFGVGATALEFIHGLGYKPSITYIGDDGGIYHPGIVHLDDTTALLNFYSPVPGTAYAS